MSPVTYLFPLLFCVPLPAAEPVLIVADEAPVMQVLAARLKPATESRIVTQQQMPAELAAYPAVIVYIHGDITEPAEKAFIAYAEGGGKLILLHHSISSGKRPNKYWLPFLGVRLPEGDVGSGGYTYVEGVTMEVVNLAPGNYVSSHAVNYPSRVEYRGSERPSLTLSGSEAYLNHVLTGPRTVLLGLKYTDPKTGKVWTEDTAGWYKKAGAGWVFYFMPGHSAADFENPAYSQIVLNAVTFNPGRTGQK